MLRFRVQFGGYPLDKNLEAKYFYAESTMHCSELVREWLGGSSVRFSISHDKE